MAVKNSGLKKIKDKLTSADCGGCVIRKHKKNTRKNNTLKKTSKIFIFYIKKIPIISIY